MRPDTLCIHAGSHPDPSTGAIMTPIYQTSTYVQEAPGVNKGFEYARSQNPTRQALEEAYALLEDGRFGLAFGSGVAATDAVLRLLSPGDEVVCGNDMYGGTYRLFTKVHERFGIRFRYVDMRDTAAVEASMSDRTRLVWVETPTNPLMNITDIAAVASIGHSHGATVVVDNTFASPYLQKPLTLGADIVMHSATKYLGGHSDVIQGALMMNDADLRDRLYFIQKSCGAVPGPMDCFLVLRGIKTLHVRMQRHCENGRTVAHWLRDNPKVARVHWPGFTDHPNHDIARGQMRDFGGMISFELSDPDTAAARKVLSSTHVFALAESLGGVESLINHPATMTHASIPREERIRNGLGDGLIRLSVGIEDVQDLIEDLDRAIG
jgi:cystathionine beta-lyase/cystathionine gamma-synthase